MESLIGKTLSNRYRIDGFLGRGGMAEVYKAWDQHRSIYLALKLLHQDLAQDKIFLRRFLREAQTLAKLQHPNIVHFYGIETDEMVVFMLMDYIEGSTLKAEIFQAKGSPLNPSLITHVMGSVCSALHFAHHQGLIHCDIKPANILIDRDGGVFLSDFGIARMADAATSSLSGFGTPAYMAPELVMGYPPSIQSDIYALGIILYEMITGGERPFTGERTKANQTWSDKVRWEQVNLAPPTPKYYNPDMTDALEAVIMKCLAKAPEVRFNTALDLMNALERLSTDQGRTTPDFHVSSNTFKPTESYSKTSALKGVGAPKGRINQGSVLRQNYQSNRLPKVLWWGGGVLLLILLLLGFNLLGGGRHQKTTGVDDVTALVDGSLSPEMDQSEAAAQTNSPSAIATSLPTSTPERILKIGSIVVNPIDNAQAVYVPEGVFLMGSKDSDADDDEKPQHLVYLGAYWIYQHEVTNAQFSTFISAANYVTTAEKRGWSFAWEGDPWQKKPGTHWTAPEGPGSDIEGLDDHPVVHISWEDAVAYCTWASGRLPTEAEWEKAARGTDGRVYPWGNSPVTQGRANFCDLNCLADWAETNQDDGFAFTAPVGSFTGGTSPYGAHDMAGNVWEWVADWYDDGYYQKSPYLTPTGPSSGKFRVSRGGSYLDNERALRVSYRDGIIPDYATMFHGFRCVYLP